MLIGVLENPSNDILKNKYILTNKKNISSIIEILDKCGYRKDYIDVTFLAANTDKFVIFSVGFSLIVSTYNFYKTKYYEDGYTRLDINKTLRKYKLNRIFGI